MSDGAGDDVFVGMGSNLGDRRQNLARAVTLIAQIPNVTVARVSSLYDTAPVGPDQPRYFNAVLHLRTRLNPRALLVQLKALERSLGRPADSPRWGPRILDLDLLHWSGVQMDEPGLTLPHPGLGERRFALEPLCELNGTLPVAARLAEVSSQDVVRAMPPGWENT